jgi:hypothetical protein
MIFSDPYVEMKVVERPSTELIAPVSTQESPVHRQPFVSAILLLKAQLREFQDGTGSSSSVFTTSSTTVGRFFSTDPSSPYNPFSTSSSSSFLFSSIYFGTFSSQLEQLKEFELLPLIGERRGELYAQKEHWRAFVNANHLGKEGDFYAQIERALKEGKLIPNISGSSSSYFLVDSQGMERFVVKPVDGDIYCLNNRKGFGSPFNDTEHIFRESIPLYRSAQTDAFCWEVASLAGLTVSTPRTVIGIVEDSGFYDFSLDLKEEVKDRVLQDSGMPDIEKLCFVQEFIPDSQNLLERLHEFYTEELSDEEIASRFDQDDFEQVCLLLWLSFDNDAHGGNFLTYVKRTDAFGNKIYGLKKIDNNLSFPEKNTQYIDILAWLPNALLPISAKLKQTIANLPVDQILQRMDDYELFNCKEAFKERVEIIKTLAQREGITTAEIDLRMSILSSKDGKEIALKTMTTQEIIELIAGSFLTTSSTP